MMAAFIVAVRGTVTQAVLLGLAATVSRTAVVWAVAMAGLYFGRQWTPGHAEPYFQFASAVMIPGVAGWMLWRTWRHCTDGALGIRDLILLVGLCVACSGIPALKHPGFHATSVLPAPIVFNATSIEVQ